MMVFRLMLSQTSLRLVIFPEKCTQAHYLESLFRESVAPMKPQGTDRRLVGSRVIGAVSRPNDGSSNVA